MICKATAEEDETEGAGTSVAAKQFTGGDMGTGEQSFSRFEQLMINQLNNIESNQKSHHKYCETHFRTWKSERMTFKESWGRCFVDQKISVHTAWLMIVPLHLMNSMGEN